MQDRRHSWPDGHWNWPIKVSHKHGIGSGPMIFIGGQVDLDPDGNVLHPRDLAQQVPAVVAAIGRVLADFDASLHDIVLLTVFYVPKAAGADGPDILDLLGAALPAGAAIAVTTVPLPWLAYPGMQVEIEVVAMRPGDGSAHPRRAARPSGFEQLPAPFVPGVRCGEMIFVGGQVAEDLNGGIVAQTESVMARLGRVLGELGADYDDVVKINRWYQGAGTEEDWTPAALACARHFAEPGPAATGIPVPGPMPDGARIKIAAIAMRGDDGSRPPRSHAWPDGHWDWPVHLPYKHGCRCGDFVFIGGQVALDRKGAVLSPGALEDQTVISLEAIRRVLGEFGLDLDHVVKVLALYSAGGDPDELHRNLSIRSAAFTEPGPATTGIPLPVLAYPGMMIEIEIIAMA